MKQLKFNRSALLKAIRLCALLLVYAASQATIQAQFNPAVGTAGNDSVTASGTFAGSFNGNGGSDSITIQSGASVTASSTYAISITAGAVMNNGSLAVTADGEIFAVFSDNGNLSLSNPGAIQVQATDPVEAIGFGTSAFSSGTNAVFNLNNNGSVQILAGSSSTYSWAYGFRAQAVVSGQLDLFFNNNGSVQVTSSSSGYSYAAGVFMGTANANSGSSTLGLTNRGTLQVTSGSSSNNNSKAYGFLANSRSEYANNLVGLTNTGAMTVSSGDASDLSSAHGAFLRAGSGTGNASIQFMNFGTMSSSSATSQNGDSLAYGLEGISSPDQGTSTINVVNRGSISSLSGYSASGDSQAFAITTTASSYQSTVILTTDNSGTISATSGDAMDEARAYGIQALATADDSLVRVTNDGTISATAGAGGNVTSAFGVEARAVSGTTTGFARVTNKGTINAMATALSGNNTLAVGIRAQGDTVEVFNSGTILVQANDNAVGIQGLGGVVGITDTGGTIITNQTYAITLNASGAGTLNINGLSNIQGVMAGFGANDTLHFNLLGVSASDATLIQDYLNLNPNTGTFIAAGLTYAYEDFETVTLQATAFSSLFAANPGLAGFAAALDGLNGTATPEFARLLSLAAFSGSPDQNFSQLAGQDILDVLNSLNLIVANQLGSALGARSMDLRHGADGLDLSGLQVQDGSLLAQANGINNRLDNLGLFAAASDRISDSPVDTEMQAAEPKKRVGAWIRGTAKMAEQETSDGIPGYDSNTYGALLGVDYKVTSNLVLGFMTGYAGNTADINGGSSVDSNSAIFGIYSVWARQGWHVEGLAAYVRSDYEMERNVLETRSSGDSSGNSAVVHVSGGYDFQAGGWKFGPTGGVQYAHTVIDGYTETGGLTALQVGENSTDSLKSILGIQGSREFDLRVVKLTPQLMAAWHHEFLNDNNNASSSFINAPALGTFNVDGREPERDFAVLGANLSAVIPGMNLITFFVGYESQVGQDSYIAHSVNGGLKASF